MVRKSREEWKIYNNVFDKFTIRTLFELSTKGFFRDLTSPVALGKEANVFLAEDKNSNRVIVKIYRLENCNFNQMYSYIQNDPRFHGLENRKRKIIFKWVQREYRNLLKAREKIRVPTPIEFKNNVLVMELIGKEAPSPLLKDKKPRSPQDFYDQIIHNMSKLLEAGIVHGDLSHFNIINDAEKPVFIDFSQGTSIKATEATRLLERDVKNICKYFEKAITLNFEEVNQKLQDKLLEEREKL